MKKNYQFFRRFFENKESRWLLAAALILNISLQAQQTFTFTTCGATGRFGPTQTQANNTYSSTNLNGSVTVSGGIQSFTVPGSGPYRITAIGAMGGSGGSSDIGGYGASMRGEFNLTAGAVLNIIVGQVGESNTSDYNAGGGGGTFVWITPAPGAPLIVAGGGGGSGTGYSGAAAVVTTSGTAGVGTQNGAAGVNGNGANPGGGGWYTAGQDFNVSSTIGSACSAKCSGGTAGITPGGASPTTAIVLQGCAGTSLVGDGGFGGGAGGSGYCTNSYGGGGGGGYSGGAGNTGGNGIYAAGGAGGSYNGGTNQLNIAGVNAGDGKVIIEQLCNVTISANGSTVGTSICSPGSVTLTTNAVSGFTWSNGNTTNTTIVVSPTVSQTYSVAGTNSTGCFGSAVVGVTVSGGLPVLTVTSNPSGPICLGQSMNLTAGGALTYTWSPPSGTITNGQPFFPSATGTYTVRGTNGCGTSSTAVTVTLAPLQLTATTNSALVCSGSTTTLTAISPATSYTWLPINAIGPSNTLVVGPQANTIYTVAASNGTCYGTATVAIATNPVPTISIVASSSVVCVGALVTMTASGAQSYTWITVTSNNASISDMPTIPTSYQVMGSNSLNCSSGASQIILTKPSPTITVSASKTLVCVGDPVVLTVSGAASYAWINGPSTATYNVTNMQSNTTFTATGTGTNGCTATQTIAVNTMSAGVSVSASSQSVCPGKSSTITATGASTSTWIAVSSSNGMAVVTPTTTTTYSVVASTNTPNLSCPSSNSITITVFTAPVVSITVNRNNICRNDASVTLTGQGASTYTWNTGPTTPTISVHPQTTTTYSITGTDINGCENVSSLQVKVNLCSGIGEIAAEDKNIMIYPNPNNGNFIVVSKTEQHLKLVSSLGQILRLIDLNESNNYRVSITDLANGIYFIMSENNSDKVLQKLIVTK